MEHLPVGPARVPRHLARNNRLGRSPPPTTSPTVPAMLIRVRHVTRYVYAEAGEVHGAEPGSRRAVQGPAHRRLAGAGCLGCPPLEFRDGFGNTVQLVTVTRPHSELPIEAAGTVETEDRSGIVAGLAKSIPPRVFLRETAQTRPDAAIRAPGAVGRRRHRQHRAAARAPRRRCATGSTTSRAPPTPTRAPPRRWPTARACAGPRPHLHPAARTLGIPAALRHAATSSWTTPRRRRRPPCLGRGLRRGAGVGSGFDVANRICPTDRYVRLACGLDAGYTAPITGSRLGGRRDAQRLRRGPAAERAAGRMANGEWRMDVAATRLAIRHSRGLPPPLDVT